MMTLMARLCALCAMCALAQMALGESREAAGIRVIGGLMMEHLVISGAQELGMRLMAAGDLMQMFEILVQ